MNKKISSSRSPLKIIILYLFISAFVLILGVRYYLKQKEEIKQEKYTELSVISDLKVKQIINWRSERYGDASVIFKSNFLISDLKKWFDKSEDINIKSTIVAQLSSYYDYYRYKDIIIFDTNAVIKYSLYTKLEKISKIAFSQLKTAAKSMKPVFGEIYFCDECNEIHLDIIIPLFNQNKLFGGIILRIDPKEFLYPLLQSWPTPSKTSETLLVTQEGDEVVYLNELRHKENTALKLRYKIDSGNSNIPAVMSAMGKTGLVEGMDYRGIPVLADIKKIENANWYMIAKVDMDEIYKPLSDKAFSVSIIIGLMLISVGIGFIWVWSNQKKSIRIQHLEEESQRKALIKHFDYVLKYANDIIILSDIDRRIIDVNSRALKEYGYSRDEMSKMNIKELLTPDSYSHVEDVTNPEEFEKGIIYETIHKRKDNSVFPVEVSAHLIEIDGKKYFQRVIRNITDRKKVEEELQKSEGLYRNLFTHMAEGFAYCRMIYKGSYPVDFRYIKVNETFENLTGLKDVESKLVTEVIPGIRTSDDKLFEIYSRVALTGKPERFEIYVEALKDWYDISVYSPKKEYFVAVFNVVTKRKATEVALKESEIKFRSLFENAILGIYRTTPDGNIIDCNPALLKMLGFKDFEELSKRNLERSGFEPGYSRSEFKGKIETEGEIIGLESKWIKKDGETIYVRENAKAIKDENGKFLFYEGTVEDITKQKQVEFDLINSEKKYRRLHESMMDGFALVDMKGNIVEFNESYRQMLGYSSDELKKLTYPDITPLKWHELENKIVGQVLKYGYSDVYEKEYRKKDGTVFPIELRTFLLKNESGENEGMWGIVRDITERKKAEETVRLSEEKFSKAFHSSPYASILTLPSDGKIIDINNGFFNITGYQDSDVSGKTTFDIDIWINYEDRKYVVNELTKGNKIYGKEFAFRKKSGEERIAFFSAELISLNNQVVMLSSFSDITELKKAEENIRSIVQRYHLILSKQYYGTLVVNEKNAVEFVNEKFCELFSLKEAPADLIGLAAEEALSKILPSYANPEYVFKLIKSVVDKGLPDFDNEIEMKDGRTLLVDHNPIIINGKYSGRIWQHRDITDRKKIELALLESEIKFRTLFESMNEGVALHELVYDKNGLPVDYRIIDVNPAYEENTGISIENAKNHLASEFYNIEIPPYLEIYSNVADTGTPYFFETYFPPLNKHFEISVFSPKKHLFATVFTDITQRKQSEEAIRESERKLREAQKMAHLGYWLWDVKTGSVEWSDEVYKIFHLDPKEFTPDIDSIMNLSPWPEENKRDKELINKSVESHEPGSYEQKFLRPDKSIGYYSSTFQGNYNEKGELVSIVGAVMDITERKIAEEKIQKLNEELEQRVIERTAQLQNLNRELESFSYSVSHDLRAPLRSIDGFSLAIYEDYYKNLDEKGKEYLERIRNATTRMDALIDSMLKLSRVTRFELKYNKVNLSSIAKEIMDNLIIQNKGRITEISIQENIIAEGDAYLLKILLDNLFANAWKFTNGKEKTIIEFGTIINDLNTIYFVKDNGAGFDMKYYDKLFGAFQRLHSQRDFPGTGVGLATAQRIVHRHNGKIWAESKIMSGTTFYFTLK